MAHVNAGRWRRSTRLPEYNYTTPGAYFITICTYQRQCFLDDPVLRHEVERTWRSVGKYSRGVRGADFVVMPNHVHGIIWFTRGPQTVGAQHVPNADDPSVGPARTSTEEMFVAHVLRRYVFPRSHLRPARSALSCAPSNRPLPNA